MCFHYLHALVKKKKVHYLLLTQSRILYTSRCETGANQIKDCLHFKSTESSDNTNHIDAERLVHERILLWSCPAALFHLGPPGKTYPNNKLLKV